MTRLKMATIVILVVGLVVIATPVRAQQAEREAMYYRYLEFASLVKGGSVQPHWMADGSSFWYAEGAPANTVIHKVDPRANTKTPLFDTTRLRKALAPVLGHEPPYKGLPFDKFTFMDKSEKAVKFTVEEKDFILELDTYTISRAPALSEEEKSRLAPQVARGGRPLYFLATLVEVLSPDGYWFATLKDHNLWLRSTIDGRRVQITTDGIEDYEWGHKKRREARWAWWSPSSLRLAVKKVDSRKVQKKPFVHWLKPLEEIEWGRYPRAGSPLPQMELFIVDILSNRQVRIDTGEERNPYIDIIGWRPDGSELLFLRMNREYKKLDLMAANPETGSTRVVLTETAKTFIHVGFGGEWARLFTLLRDGQRFIWQSERDGWNHLYLYDLKGNLIRRLSQGRFSVLRWAPMAVHEKSGWVYFTAIGDKQRLYDTHLYRVNLEGQGFTQLTQAPGQHWTQFAPSKDFFLDTHSSLDRPPTVELRRADGTLLQTLSTANIDALKAELKWRPPEEFVVKAADGKTDLYGVLYKPYDFDPRKKYPVLELNYAAANVVPHTFIPFDWAPIIHAQALAQLGFVVFIVDARGTGGRGRNFLDVVYRNFGRYEIPDHVAALKQLAAKRPYMDLGRVGIFGHSWGGYFTLRALLLAPEVYHVGVASAPVVDTYTGAIAHEPFMGLPQNNKEGYEYASNLRFVHNLKGKLLLIVGTNDVLFAGTMKMVDALVRAGKPYDLIVLPEEGHGFRGTSAVYAREATRRYFQEHLQP